MGDTVSSVWAQAGLRLPSGPEEQLDALQLELNQRLGTVALLPESDAGYGEACDEVFAAALALVAAENQIPVQLAMSSHRFSRWLLYGCGAFTLLVGVGVGLSVGWRWLPLWWGIGAVLVLLAGVLVATARVPPPSGPHVRQRAGGIEVALGAGLFGWLSVAFGLAPGMSGRTALWVFGASAALALLGLATLRTSVRVHDA